MSEQQTLADYALTALKKLHVQTTALYGYREVFLQSLQTRDNYI